MQTKENNDTLENVTEEYGLDVDAFSAYCDNIHITSNYADQVTNFTDAYIGEMSPEEYAEELADDIYPEAVKSGYFDYEKFTNDLLMGDIYECGGYLFRNY